jgi:hypothetical protein
VDISSEAKINKQDGVLLTYRSKTFLLAPTGTLFLLRLVSAAFMKTHILLFL